MLPPIFLGRGIATACACAYEHGIRTGAPLAHAMEGYHTRASDSHTTRERGVRGGAAVQGWCVSEDDVLTSGCEREMQEERERRCDREAASETTLGAW